MQFTLEQILELIEDDVSSHLIPKAAYKRIKKVASYFPAALAKTFGFEIRMSGDDKSVDFAFMINEEEGGLGILTGNNPHIRLPDEIHGHPEWQRILFSVDEWATPGTRFNRHINKLWLEFDVDEDAPMPPVPGFMFGLNTPANESDPARSYGVLPAGDRVEFTKQTYEKLKGVAIPERILPVLTRCLNSLPERGRIFHLGSMLSREVPAVRLCLDRISFRNAIRYLQKIGWAGDLDQVVTAGRDLLSGNLNHLALVLDVGESVLPRVGFECYCHSTPYFMDVEVNWRPLIERLVDAGLCRPEIAEELLAWPRHQRMMLPHQFWYSQVSQLLNHIKLDFHADKPVAAKAYFGVIYRPALQADARMGGRSAATTVTA